MAGETKSLCNLPYLHSVRVERQYVAQNYSCTCATPGLRETVMYCPRLWPSLLSRLASASVSPSVPGSPSSPAMRACACTCHDAETHTPQPSAIPAQMGSQSAKLFQAHALAPRFKHKMTPMSW